MSVKQIFDAGGVSSMTVVDLDGRLYPNFPVESLRSMATFKARPDDVAVCAYPKSGTHWIWEIVKLVLAGTTDGPMVEKGGAMLELSPPEEVEAQKSPRTLNIHTHFECLPPEFLSKKVRIIYVTRDPRDVAVSFFNHQKRLTQFYNYDGEWKNYLPNFKTGQLDYESWFQHTKGWEKGIKDHPDLPVHVTSYEAMHKNGHDEVRKIAKFLGLDRDKEFIEKVVQKCSFAVMQESKGKLETFETTGSKPVMYRKGKTGDWKNWFTVAQSESFDELFEEEMRGTNTYQLYSHAVSK